MYDVVIIGGGPAGFTAALYCARAKLKTVLFEKYASGGQMAISELMENYPGLKEPISGYELAKNMENQIKNFGVSIINENVIELDINGKVKKIITEKDIYTSKTVILSMGTLPKQLGIDKEESFVGMGVSYCAICDGSFYEESDVAVIGGGDTSVEYVEYLSKICNKIYLIHRRDSLRAANILIDKIKNNEKIKILWNSVVVGLVGETQLKGIQVKNIETNLTSKIDVEGIFIAIGTNPNIELIKNKVKLSENNYILTDENMNTNIPGVFAAGDIREKVLRQVVTATSDGAVAAFMAEKYISMNG